MQENTGRPIAIEQGTNRLAGTGPRMILRAAREALDAPLWRVEPPQLWDGKASVRILDVLERAFTDERPTLAGRLTAAP